MCLDVVYRGKDKKEALAKLPDEFPVWKVLWRTENGQWVTDTCRAFCRAGEQQADFLGMSKSAYPEDPRYRCGWHAFLRRKGAVGWMDGVTGAGHIVRCMAKKKHIRTIGIQTGHVVVVLSHITFPKKCGVRKT